MFRRGRPEEPHFEPAETLYRWYRREHWIIGVFTGVGFPFPKHSVNRGRFCEAEDVLFSGSGEFNGWGVLEFQTKDIPDRLEQAPAPGFQFFVKHVPFEDNFAHSEIWSDRIEQTGWYVEPSQSIRKLFRTKMGQKMRIRIEAVI